MSSRTSSDFGTLGERSAQASRTPNAAAASEAGDPRVPAPETRVVEPQHVWVDGSHPGLLLAWRRLGVWQARVFWCPPDLGEAALDWISQQRVRPAQPHQVSAPPRATSSQSPPTRRAAL